jgi:IS30 family transposase
MTKYKRLTAREVTQILETWSSGQGRVKDIANMLGRPEGTIYSVLLRAGIWPGCDDYTRVEPELRFVVTESRYKGRLTTTINVARKHKRRISRPVIVESVPSLWDRIKAVFVTA